MKQGKKKRKIYSNKLRNLFSIFCHIFLSSPLRKLDNPLALLPAKIFCIPLEKKKRNLFAIDVNVNHSNVQNLATLHINRNLI